VIDKRSFNKAACRRLAAELRAEIGLQPMGTVTLIGMCSGAVGFGAVAMDQLWVVGISGGGVERGNPATRQRSHDQGYALEL